MERTDISHCTKKEVFHRGFLQWTWPSLQFPAYLITFTEEILIGRLHSLRSESPASPAISPVSRSLLSRNCQKLDVSKTAFTCSKSTSSNFKTICEIYWKLTVKTLEQCQWRFGVFIVYFEQILIILMLPMSALHK